MIALLGYGKTNQALLEFINHNGEKCVVFDDAFIEKRIDSFGNNFLPPLQKVQTRLQIPSPGIPPFHPMIKQAQSLVSEYDFLLGDIKRQIWISGTNGKTTTTEMLEWILKDCGGISGGNIGVPLASLATLLPKIWILETSSFSLHYTQSVFPQVYLLLPIREDHISWHGSFDAYVRAKLSPIERMNHECVAVIPKEFEMFDEVLKSSAHIVTYGTSEDLADYFGFDLSQVKFQEPFLLDAMLALSGAKILTGKDLSKKLLDYKVGAHKVEEFQDEIGRVWVDDSKGTNVDATIWALRSYRGKKIYLILGGDDKGADLVPLFQELQEYDAEIFGIGSNVERLGDLAQKFKIRFSACYFLEQAIKEIDLKHSLESIAMLSPAASSLDQFVSYKQRGELFQEMAKKCRKA
ncbi:UDP-N-acetylmuramoyl-L-alanine--D-glutamate ligase [Helicobacter kayseriensis]|uniref:UDP-N-acetylmuramoyl-L-alanine--D-glutamate ligase n=1 Tax=Helicobacter kayseriensis TaxID=2905877 RepID=UPI001E49C091|nr:UDP-N-acetylmuramoyl-L-alanine--D-glutamate ligase [Helicobacter kayseriensis]MCE3047282.1 UDP-N-acetylmuramoyl-L-alanine--D-glutamate ligase [Helicobacter kayseriensis]MCE3048653.1 UDP-N-acetylmuramoyl-L-alanine--D-glutamate ligase [Helicobacter kayseriensis]